MKTVLIGLFFLSLSNCAHSSKHSFQQSSVGGVSRSLASATADIPSLIQNRAELNLSSKIGTSGFATLERARSAVQTDFGTSSVFQEFNERFVIGIRSPQSVRSLILAGGFKNQHQLLTRGDENLRKMAATESGILNLDGDTFETIPPVARPIYGSLMAKPELSEHILGPRQYGEDLWVVKTGVMQRCTWTTADSWALYNDWDGRGWDHRQKSFSQRDWTHLALPISSIELAIPFIDEMGRTSAPIFPMRPDRPYYKGQIMPPRQKDDNSFVELQIWGGVSVNDISDLVFSNVPPSHDIAETLRKQGIKIWDGRNSVRPTLYTGD